MTDEPTEREVGVGPHAQPWPDDPRLDPELLASGDRRNVVDQYRYWRNDAIVADLDSRRHPFHVAIENWQHDMNIGSVVRNANAFLAAEVHIIGRRRWNKRGAMVTDRYQHMRHHGSIDEFVAWARETRLPIIGIDILSGARPIDETELPERCVCCWGRRDRACRTTLGPPSSASARSGSSVLPARSTQAWRRASPCTTGFAGTAT